MRAGEFELARKAYLRAALERGFDVDILSALGSADLRLGRLGQAEERLRDAMDRDPTFVPALNNLGVVLMETGRTAEAAEVFRAAFANDSGQSDAIRANLARALAKRDDPAYADPEKESFALVRRGRGDFLILGAAEDGA
ncbi:tetratricopeptide repeat protein [Palleronia sediminis]|uniref:Tetratricopeptide repeat protein n=2 Tax=Palleronia sediminis TaxID=2547833 RepID=A0A4R5ZYR3_9RHOB|nr:tetratricopeptide repeat protein [Palleronia sediminis]